MPQPLQDESPPTEPLQALPMAASTMKFPKTRHSTSTIESLPLSGSETTLAFRRSNPSRASLYASTLSPPGSRSISPTGRGSPSRVLSNTVFNSRPPRSPASNAGDSPTEPLNLILKAYVPHVSIYASEDTETLMSEKGFRNGLWELLRPFGEDLQGKVTVRDSNGMSRTTEDFSIRFTRFGQDIEHPDPKVSGLKNPSLSHGASGAQASTERDKQLLANVEAVVDRHLSYAEESFAAVPQGAFAGQGSDSEETSPYYALYLRRLLSGIQISPHETFAHPVACVIAISSRNQNPIEELRRLYEETSQGEKKLPAWVDGDYLRYYVLIHDEEKDDITRSMGLFDQMKRHLGLHCHLLRLRSSASAETDDDSIPLPRSDWMSATEELEDIKRSQDDEDFEDPTMHIFESDATAIRTFVREMVTQSIVPTMERHISIWNDQVASRRRGLTGRFMNLSRKWAFGGSSRSSTSGTSSSKDTYNMAGFYQAEAPEAIMRKLADYAFMLRDWKLAHSTYDLLRSDFSDSKAWKHHAAANEMAAASLLIMPQHMTSKNRAETIDQMLEAAFYSYNTRCCAPYGALRSLTLGLELLRLRGGTSIDDAGRWGIRLLDSKIAGNVGDALMKERLGICYGSKQGVGSWHWGSRRRKSAAWTVLAADAWLQQSKHIQARQCLDEAHRRYAMLPHKDGILKFPAAGDFMASLQNSLAESPDTSDNEDGSADDDDANIDEESEALTDLRARRVSTVVMVGLETAPLHRDVSAEEQASQGGAQKDFD
ncbi:ER-golgi trafficking TRAPP I complex 85 kDa subunit-domain-containing protein [Dactylonectria estremocensis]|uniref:ER-golgi trafficking TRAPP I complex 85 kDa subunit-domain-containing protein n=1 Tax=Dactylonectria estremocensis TaxID=1079267 RepID=A0A9P9JJ74_9HYPO|nr:ER-golgi trafficking TRAPP I complex 85 kDa subunit-domain-containing protein [Dactylonectria estremocensis]